MDSLKVKICSFNKEAIAQRTFEGEEALKLGNTASSIHDKVMMGLENLRSETQAVFFTSCRKNEITIRAGKDVKDEQAVELVNLVLGNPSVE